MLNCTVTVINCYQNVMQISLSVSFDSRRPYDLIISSQNKINSLKMYSIARLNDLCLNEEIPVD